MTITYPYTTLDQYTIYPEIFAVCIFHGYVLRQEFRALNFMDASLPRISRFNFHGSIQKFLFSATQLRRIWIDFYFKHHTD